MQDAETINLAKCGNIFHYAALKDPKWVVLHTQEPDTLFSNHKALLCNLFLAVPISCASKWKGYISPSYKEWGGKM